MQINDAINTVKVILLRNPIPNRTKVIAKMQVSGWLDTRKNYIFFVLFEPAT